MKQLLFVIGLALSLCGFTEPAQAGLPQGAQPIPNNGLVTCQWPSPFNQVMTVDGCNQHVISAALAIPSNGFCQGKVVSYQFINVGNNTVQLYTLFSFQSKYTFGGNSVCGGWTFGIGNPVNGAPVATVSSASMVCGTNPNGSANYSANDGNGGCYCPPLSSGDPSYWNQTLNGGEGMCVVSPSLQPSPAGANIFYNPPAITTNTTSFIAQSTAGFTYEVDGTTLGNSNNTSVTAVTMKDGNGNNVGTVTHNTANGVDVWTATVPTAVRDMPYTISITTKQNQSAPYAAYVLTAPGTLYSDWTPAITFGGASTGITYSTQQGSYTVSNGMMHGEFFIVLTSKGSSTGYAQIVGLPKSCIFAPGGGAITWSSNWASGVMNSTPIMQTGTNGVWLEKWNGNGGTTSIPLSNTDFTNTTNLIGFFDCIVQ